MSLREEPCTVPRAGAARRQGLRRAGASPRQSETPRNDHLFLHPLGNYRKGSFRVEKDGEILHWVSGFGINSFRKEDLL